MNDLVVHNARILDVASNDLLSSYNIVGVSNGKITCLESSNTLSKNELNNLIKNSKESIDLKNKWLTPGLIDCHTHLVFAGSRANEFAARLSGSSYEEITRAGGGINATVSATREISLDNLIKLSERRIIKAIQKGVTTIEIKSGYGLDYDSEKKILQTADYLSKNYPITIQKTFLGAHIVPKEFKGNPEQYIQYLTDQVLPELYQQGLIDAVDGFCEKIAFSTEQLEPLYKKARELGLVIKGHTEQLSNIGGANLVCKYGGVSCDHLEYADMNTVKILHESECTAVLLPGAYYYLNETQKPPIDLLREYKVPIAIATDFNPGTSPVLSLIAIMNMACVLYKLTPLEVWQAVTLNAAKALKLDNELGSIELNKKADLIAWDFDHPYDVCYYMDYSWNKTIIKNGKVINY